MQVSIERCFDVLTIQQEANFQTARQQTNMKYQILSLLATTSAVALANDDHRNLATLAQKWNLTEPTFEYESNTFSLTFEVTDFINTGMVDYSL